MISTHRTYCRTDGENVYDSRLIVDASSFAGKRLSENRIAHDYIEEEWSAKGELTRYRTVRLGLPEPCDNHCKFGVIMIDNRYVDNCNLCDETGIKPRNPEPSWIEVDASMAEPEHVHYTHSNIHGLCTTEVFTAPDGIRGIRVVDPDWDKVVEILNGKADEKPEEQDWYKIAYLLVEAIAGREDIETAMKTYRRAWVSRMLPMWRQDDYMQNKQSEDEAP